MTHWDYTLVEICDWSSWGAQYRKCKTLSNPNDNWKDTIKSKSREGKGADEKSYSLSSVIGALQYLTLTRSDISYTMNKLSQFMQNPTMVDWQAVKRVLRYLKGSVDCGIHLKPSKIHGLTTFLDGDWGSCPHDWKSVSGYCVDFGDSLISWSSKKQHVVSRFSTESKYRAFAFAVAELT